MTSEALAKLEGTLRADGVLAALRVGEEQLRQFPNDADVHRRLAQLHAIHGARDKAMSAAQDACALAPADPRAWSDRGRVHARFGAYQDAAHCFTQAIRLDEQYADGWHNLGTALKKLGDTSAAFAAFKHALQIAPTRSDTYLNLGNLLIDTGQIEDAIECFERAARHDPNLAAARSRLAQQLSQRGRVVQAESLFRQAVGLDPEHVQGWSGLGRTLEDLGDAANALACYRQVLQRRPDHALALGHYLALVREEASPEILDRAQRAVLDAASNDEAKAVIGYGLTKYHDRHGEYASAAEMGRAANEARRRVAGPANRRGLQERIDGSIATYDQEFFFQRRRFGLGTDQPVFIVGLPRSGTTLCEQIVSSHPDVHGAGELPDLANLAVTAIADTGAAAWQAAAQVTMERSRDLATSYLRALRTGAGKGRLRIIDKSPLNFFQLAFVTLLFPSARIIHCVRDARDNALSIWMENFNPEQGYATDFGDLAFFRTEYERLMAHWRRVSPLRVLDVRYEDTVADVEAQARRMLDFLGVSWDPRCLEFHRNDRAVQTPSRWQVRQPIYPASVGRWQRYAPYLPELLANFPDPSSLSDLPGACSGTRQPGKVTPFAGGNEATIRKSAAGDFFQCTSQSSSQP